MRKFATLNKNVVEVNSMVADKVAATPKSWGVIPRIAMTADGPHIEYVVIANNPELGLIIVNVVSHYANAVYDYGRKHGYTRII